ncbi:hypothetical protein AF72_06970 [Xylella taiwanensis]|uniref:Uncharacterized protein n=1 Tax=Xylella taiwanensis TaxID=1444770 RepID=Z9JIK6_9GAMM|nr:hypothetical protein AB672_07225 [Xylella taiwanensis]EWS78240.1 hypothetical protein AF72_06970 [Xylella taiwanensis]
MHGLLNHIPTRSNDATLCIVQNAADMTVQTASLVGIPLQHHKTVVDAPTFTLTRAPDIQRHRMLHHYGTCPIMYL